MLNFVKIFLIHFQWGWGLNSGFILAKQVLYHLSHTSNPFFFGYFGDECKLFPQADLKP
jgi:hypothetical protein